MIFRYVLPVLFIIISQPAFNQNRLPLIKASSKYVDIRDGLHFMKHYWLVMPEKKPDYYYVEIPEKSHQVTFITDMDSISFNVEYEKEYDFIILLNNRDSCLTRIVTKYRNPDRYKSITVPGIPDTIPFTIGDNSKIYFKGRVNNSDTLNIQFDLGSGGTIIKKASVQKVKMNFDDSVILSNSDGINKVPASKFNILHIGNLEWDSIYISVADNMTSREDMITGNRLFNNKILEIDYDKKIMIIYDSLPVIDASYTRHDMILDGSVVPFIEATLQFKSKNKKGWFLFDTGAYTSILNNEHIPAANKIFYEAKKMIGLDNRALVPSLTIGSHSFTDFGYVTQNFDQNGLASGILGNDLLKRFNIILDNKKGHIYLKPNSLANEPYSNPEYYVARIAIAILILLVTVIAYVMYKRKKRKIMTG